MICDTLARRRSDRLAQEGFLVAPRLVALLSAAWALACGETRHRLEQGRPDGPFTETCCCFTWKAAPLEQCSFLRLPKAGRCVLGLFLLLVVQVREFEMEEVQGESTAGV